MLSAKIQEFFIRSFTSIFIVAVTLYFIYSNNFYFSSIFLAFIGILMAYEWAYITYKQQENRKLKLVGALYIFGTLLPLLILKRMPGGNHLLMWLFIIIWATDTFAYIFGALLKLGKHKINKISPKKSYEGLFFGIIGSLIFGYIFAFYFLSDIKMSLLLITPILCVVEQTSDFIGSYIKRKFNVKDSGNILPGHGGIIDRLDGLLLTTGFFISILKLLGS
jgi:phosphatidate cytidylyltransferase